MQRNLHGTSVLLVGSELEVISRISLLILRNSEAKLDQSPTADAEIWPGSQMSATSRNERKR